jgi:hypothetical protein
LNGYTAKHRMRIGGNTTSSSDHQSVSIKILASRSLMCQVENLNDVIPSTRSTQPDYYYEQLNGKGRRLKTARSVNVEVHLPGNDDSFPTYLLDRKVPRYTPDQSSLLATTKSLARRETMIVPSLNVEPEIPIQKLIEVDGHVIVDRYIISRIILSADISPYTHPHTNP